MRMPLLLAALALAAPAHAASLTISDPSGDASGPLDIVGATFDNGPSRDNADSDLAPAHGDRFHPTRWIDRG